MSGIITAADVVATMTVTNLYTSGFTLQGFTADNIFDVTNLELAETVMGVDGTLSAGAILTPMDQTWHIMPDSATYTKFQTWATTSRTSIAVYRCNATIIFPTHGKKYTCTNGVLINCTTMASAAKTVQPITALIRWESVTPSEYSS
ncbi:hypothetical protein [Serratia sp. M24T3]|uniref:phage tail fiber protein n=1 Tax=Serratia sp. M24T3 TaxID=932213 RepID=UPI00025B8F3A|nr:hypothetical protein [Serratia sp. M24T3]EIC83984.1 hypothetical protein SPM24T3_13745 [Serratia sp. M24T3]